MNVTAVSMNTKRYSFKGITITSSVPEKISRAIMKNKIIENAAQRMNITVDRYCGGNSSRVSSCGGLPVPGYDGHSNCITITVNKLSSGFLRKFLHGSPHISFHLDNGDSSVIKEISKLTKKDFDDLERQA